MNRNTRFVGLCFLCVGMGLIGCSSRGFMTAFQKKTPDSETLLAETDGLLEGDAETPGAAPTNEQPVRQTSATRAVAPTLMTLDKDADLNEAIGRAPGPVLLDFYADWCGPCRTQGKILHDMESIAAAHQTQIIKINVDEHPELAKQMKVASLPTLVMLKDGKVVQRQTGVADQQRLAAWLE